MDDPELDQNPSSTGPYLHRTTDLESICQQQREEILSLQGKLRDKDRQLADLTKILHKYASIIPELKAVTKGRGEDLAPAGSPSGGDFWDSHVDRGDTTVNFEEIASRGLWIMSSSAQPSGLPKSIDSKPTLRAKGAGNEHKRTESLPNTTFEDVESTPGRKNLRLKQLVRPAGPVGKPLSKGENGGFTNETDRSAKRSPEIPSKPLSNSSLSGKAAGDMPQPRIFHRKLPAVVGGRQRT